MQRSLALALALALVGPWTGAPAQEPAARPELAAVAEELARPYVARDGRHGVVIGLLREGQRHFWAFGHRSRAREAALDADTIFEIGSITKVFTGVLLARLEVAEKLRLEDPAQSLLPEDVAMPRKGEREIRLVDLATHYSGLPRLPDNVRGAPMNPYSKYTVERLYEFLERCEPAREVGEAYEYSNLGAGLLGHLLARRADTKYEALVVGEICEPLGLTDTMITLSEEQQSRMARGHLLNSLPTANWDIPVIGGAGALLSTARDLLRFTEACMAPGDDALGRAIASSITPRSPEGKRPRVALGWHVSGRGDDRLVWHNGATGGYCSYMGFWPERDTAIVVLANRQRERRSPLGEIARGLEASAAARDRR